jgi:hypothetical protein
MTVTLTTELERPEDRAFWARNLIAAKKRANKKTPVQADLEDLITGIQITDEMRGSSTIKVTVHDLDWELVDSGFFDADANGRLDRVEVNYPEDSRYWWSLTQQGLDEGSRGGGAITLTFMERGAVQMMEEQGPLKVKRGATTRAEFLLRLVKGTTRPRLTFISKELHKTQTIGTGRQLLADRNRKDDVRDDEKRDRKEQGIAKHANLKIKGVKADAEQLSQIERALRVASSLNAPEHPILAMLCAGIGESSFRAIMNTAGSGYGGVFQGDVAARYHYFKVDDTEQMARYFLLGGKGFQQGGAIKLSKQGLNVGEIATRVEASGKPGSFYGVYLREARAILEAWGGGDPVETTVFERADVWFKVGSRETYWDAANRLADDVRWAFFLDGDHAYFDSELTLIRQKPVLIVERGADHVVSFSSNWDARHIATEATLRLVCEPFEFRAGEVFEIRGYSMASTGSTAKLPGRWLIERVERDRWDVASTFTLRQPEKPRNEPLGELVERKQSEVAGEDAGTLLAGGSLKGSPKEIIDKIVLPMSRACGVPRTVAQNDAANAVHGPTVSGNPSDHQGPPTRAWAADMSNGSSPTPEMDKLANRLADAFGMDRLDMNTTGAAGSRQTSETSRDGFRFQLIYRSSTGGNHDNHVHFGCRKL